MCTYFMFCYFVALYLSFILASDQLTILGKIVETIFSKVLNVFAWVVCSLGEEHFIVDLPHCVVVNLAIS